MASIRCGSEFVKSLQQSLQCQIAGSDSANLFDLAGLIYPCAKSFSILKPLALTPLRGDRLVEDRLRRAGQSHATGQIYHCYLNPERDMPQGGVRGARVVARVLSDKPLFALGGQRIPAFNRRRAAHHS